MVNMTTNGVKKHHKSTEPENHKIGYFLSIFRWASSKLCESITVAFTQNSSLYIEQCMTPFPFSQLWSLTRYLKPTTQELWLHLGHHFQILYPYPKAIMWQLMSELGKMFTSCWALCEWFDFSSMSYQPRRLALHYNNGNNYGIFSALPYCVGTVSLLDSGHTIHLLIQ